MSIATNAVFCVAAALVAAPCFGGVRTIDPAPTEGGAAAIVAKMKPLMAMPRVRTRQEYKTEVNKRMPEVLKLASQLEQQYPEASEVHGARMIGIIAAGHLAQANNDAAMVARADALAKKIMASKAPVQLKVFADARVLMLRMMGVARSATMPAPDRPKLVRQFVQRHAKTDAAADALKVAVQFAEQMDDAALQKEMTDTLVKRFPDDPVSRRIASQIGVGKAFKAKLTRLDGTTLDMPKDLLGKVVLVDFWATWCGPCVAEVPRMVQIYAQYKPKGVEFVGISLDREGDKAKLESFVKDRKMDWVHTFSGRGWQDPTAQLCGVRGIPSMWVIGKDGKVMSKTARRDPAGTIEKALKAPAPTTAPAGK